MKKGGCKFGHWIPKSCLLPKCGGCSFAVGTYPQIVSSPPGGSGQPGVWSASGQY